MTWSQIKIDDLFFWVEWLLNDIDTNWIVEKAYHWLWDARIHIEADPGNTDYISIAENPWVTADKTIKLFPGWTKTFKRSDVKKENIFYYTWTAWDLIYIIVR